MIFTRNNDLNHISSQKTNNANALSLIKSDPKDSLSIEKSPVIKYLKKDTMKNVQNKLSKINTIFNPYRLNVDRNISRDLSIFDSLISNQTCRRINRFNTSEESTFLSSKYGFDKKICKRTYHDLNQNNDILEKPKESHLSIKLKPKKYSDSNSNLLDKSYSSINKSKGIRKENSRILISQDDRDDDLIALNRNKDNDFNLKSTNKNYSKKTTLNGSSSNLNNSYLKEIQSLKNINNSNNHSINTKKFSVASLCNEKKFILDSWDLKYDTNTNFYSSNSKSNHNTNEFKRKRNTDSRSLKRYQDSFKTRRTIRNKRSFLLDANDPNSLHHHFNDDYGDAIQINNYRIIKDLGKGSFGVVKLCENINENNKKYAMKIVDKNKLKKLEMKPSRLKKKYKSNMIENEINILNKISHNHTVKCFEIIDTKEHQYTYFILEYMKNGSFKELIHKGLEVEKIWNYFRHLILGIEYCHEQIKLIHFDIKPDNLLIDENYQLKITDFGISYQFIDDNDIVKHFSQGTPFFKAPEMTYNKPFHGKPCDIWSIGVTLFYSIYKIYPFYVYNSYDISKLYEKIRKDELVFPKTPRIDENLNDLITRMLVKDPEQRITLNEIMFHPWITKNNKIPLSSCFNSNKDIKNNYFSDLLEVNFVYRSQNSE